MLFRSGGFLQRTAQPLHPTNPTRYNGQTLAPSGVISHLMAPGPHAPILTARSQRLALADMLTGWTRTTPEPRTVLPGYGLIPLDGIPQPNPLMAEAWGDREVDPMTGRIGHLKNNRNTQFKLQHSSRLSQGKQTMTTLYRAQVVAATAFGYHPLTPVMAWYIHDPQTHGYGIDNIYTPTQAGYYQLEANPGPPQPHESESDYNPPQSKRFVYHPDPLPDWPDPLPTNYDWMP